MPQTVKNLSGVQIAGIVGLCTTVLVVPFVIAGVLAPMKGSDSTTPSSPPAIVYPIVWFVLYVCAGAALALQIYWPTHGSAQLVRVAATLMAAQLLLGFAWPLIRKHCSSNVATWAIVGMLLLAFPGVVLTNQVNGMAASLWAPYVAWLLFALMLMVQDKTISHVMRENAVRGHVSPSPAPSSITH
jgi:tryptophan-rich sensory protein